MLCLMPLNGLKGKIMRLLSAFFNIFIFYYFLALCGSPEGKVAGGAEGVESQPVQSRQLEEKPCKPGEDSCQVGALGYSSSISLRLWI